MANSTRSHLIHPRFARFLLWLTAMTLAVIILIQNWRTTETRLLFIEVRMPHTLFILLVLTLGVAIGLATPGLLSRRRR